MGKSAPSAPAAPDPSEFRLSQFTPQGNLVFGNTDASGIFVFDPSAADAASSIQESPFSRLLRQRQENIGGTLAQQAQGQARGLSSGQLTTAGLPGIPGFTGGQGFAAPQQFAQPQQPGQPQSFGPVGADQILGAGGADFVSNNIGDFEQFGLNAGSAAIPGTPGTPAGGGQVSGSYDSYGNFFPGTGSVMGPGGPGTPAIPGTPGTPAVAASSISDIENAIRGDADFRALLADRLGVGGQAVAPPVPLESIGTSVPQQTVGNFDVGGASQSLANLETGTTQPGFNQADAARQQAQDAFFQQQMALLNPQFDRQENRLRQNLANRGQPIAPGTAGGDEFGLFQDALNRSTEQASLGSVLAGNDEFARQVGLSQGVRGQLFGENSAIRQNQFNELASMLGGQQIVGQAPGFQLPDPANAANASQRAQLAQFQAQSQMDQANKSGLFGLGAAGLGAYGTAAAGGAAF